MLIEHQLDLAEEQLWSQQLDIKAKSSQQQHSQAINLILLFLSHSRNVPDKPPSIVPLHRKEPVSMKRSSDATWLSLSSPQQ